MITNSLIGRYGQLGNQLVQYAFVYAQARRLKRQAFLNAEAPGWSLNRYPRSDSRAVRLVSARDFQGLYAEHIRGTLRETSFQYSHSLAQGPDGQDYIGYFQSERYFDDFAEELRTQLGARPDNMTVRGRLCENWIRKSPQQKVAVHVRRGDYLHKPRIHTNLLSTDYYEKAICVLDRLLGSKYTLVVFSDDIDWCSRSLALPKVGLFVSTDDANDDLYLQTLCNHHIIANSTFSWWGAWLAAACQHIVLAPSQWFGVEGPLSYDSLYCKGWNVV